MISFVQYDKLTLNTILSAVVPDSHDGYCLTQSLYGWRLDMPEANQFIQLYTSHLNITLGSLHELAIQTKALEWQVLVTFLNGALIDLADLTAAVYVVNTGSHTRESVYSTTVCIKRLDENTWRIYHSGKEITTVVGGCTPPVGLSTLTFMLLESVLNEYLIDCNWYATLFDEGAYANITAKVLPSTTNQDIIGAYGALVYINDQAITVERTIEESNVSVSINGVRFSCDTSEPFGLQIQSTITLTQLYNPVEVRNQIKEAWLIYIYLQQVNRTVLSQPPHGE